MNSPHDSPIALPLALRSRAAHGLTVGAARGRFDLQICSRCGAAQYPPREACHVCLSVALEWRAQEGLGELISETTLYHSNDPYFRERLPWRVGLVHLDIGPRAVVHVHGQCGAAPSRVRVSARLDKSGQGVLIAFPPQQSLNMAEDRQLREMTCDPKSRTILIVDGTIALGRALIAAFILAGADHIWVGHAKPMTEYPGIDAIASLPQVTLVSLDPTDAASVKIQAELVGSRLDVVINNAGSDFAEDCDRHMDGSGRGMDLHYGGSLLMMREFGVPFKSGAAHGHGSAWVNILSACASGDDPSRNAWSASQSAVLSLSQVLRADMRSAGVRVINIYPGALDYAHPGSTSKPSASALARVVVESLRDAIEEVYPEVGSTTPATWKARSQPR